MRPIPAHGDKNEWSCASTAPYTFMVCSGTVSFLLADSRYSLIVDSTPDTLVHLFLCRSAVEFLSSRC
jgi:hypothetical protein